MIWDRRDNRTESLDPNDDNWIIGPDDDHTWKWVALAALMLLSAAWAFSDLQKPKARHTDPSGLCLVWAEDERR